MCVCCFLLASLTDNFKHETSCNIIIIIICVQFNKISTALQVTINLPAKDKFVIVEIITPPGTNGFNITRKEIEQVDSK